jgi:heterodisulfide reductase subunit A
MVEDYAGLDDEEEINAQERKVPNAYDSGLSKRKAIYVQYEAIPLKYTIDAEQCIYLTRGKCKACQKFCPTAAIDFDDQPQERYLRSVS